MHSWRSRQQQRNALCHVTMQLQFALHDVWSSLVGVMGTTKTAQVHLQQALVPRLPCVPCH